MSQRKSFSRLMSIVTMAALAFAMGSAVLSSQATAQTHGSVTLAAGFMPDPQSLSGMGGGAMDASVYGVSPTGACNGWIPNQPNHVMFLSTAFNYLSVQVTSQTDTTLLIQGPDGTFCNDDTNGLNPAISRSWSPGAYNIYVGTYSQGNFPPYTISFTELGGAATAGPVGPGGLMLTSTTPTYGQLTLAPGFMPDPQSLAGTSGGTIDAGQLESMVPTGGCRGYINANPNHQMVLTAPFNYLKVSVAGQGDTTMVIYGPQGWMCNDDFSGLSPGFEGSWAPGTYSIWVGSYSSGMAHPYTLSFTELGSTGTVAPPPTGLNTMSMTPYYGTVNLSAGFMPDPQTLSGNSGGPLSARDIADTAWGSCRGYVSDQPDHILNVGSNMNYLRIDVQSQGDTTLVIQGPDGWRCNDDTVGLNPRIDGAWMAGTYRIWVGSYASGTQTPYTITFTEYAP
ncbi:MAG: hypothetical protein JW797_11880 [Bradymonadales bacterium]|nr:hypothetical protein [Bradymonadales bacterium]